ncbi:MAG: hypothetical protein AAFO87_17715 [Cyanobacteria bacterium J06607_6]
MASPTASSVHAVSEPPAASIPAGAEAAETVEVSEITPDRVDDLFKELKTLLSTVEKLQKAREDVGDIKSLLLRLLDGELLSGDELEQVKGGVSGLSKLVKLYGDYQQVLERAQPARALLDDVLKS